MKLNDWKVIGFRSFNGSLPRTQCNEFIVVTGIATEVGPTDVSGFHCEEGKETTMMCKAIDFDAMTANRHGDIIKLGDPAKDLVLDFVETGQSEPSYRSTHPTPNSSTYYEPNPGDEYC